MSKLKYKWKRFWYPRGQEISLSDEGFLPDPEDKALRFFNPDAVTLESLTDQKCLVLLGEPGIGKTYTVEENRHSIKKKVEAQGDQTLWLNLNAVGSEYSLDKNLFEDAVFTNWANSKSNLHLFLDSVDECLLEIKKLGPLLINRFERYPHDRLHLRLACRTADWINTLENGLKDIWGKDAFAVYELAPLRKIDVIEAAKVNGLESLDFLNEIKSKAVEPLAIKPITLTFLVNTYKENNCFPTTQEELYSKGCRLLCEETNESRRDAGLYGQFTAEQRMIVASRIAAISVFANRYAIRTNLDLGDVPDEDFTIEDISGGNERVNGKTFEVERPIIKETLGTGLFSSRGSNRIGWSHRTFAEYLAAYYLKKHQLTLDQMMNMLIHPGDPERKIFPSLQEVAAWLAGMIPDVFKKIHNSEPVVLLRSDVAKADNKTRSDLVKNLLRQYDETDFLDNEHPGYYGRLKHPKLAEQLRLYLRDDTKSIDARNVAIGIADACRIQEVVDDLLEIILDARQQNQIRVKAACAISRIGFDKDGINVQSLRKLALDDVEDDPNDEIKGCVLRALWPSHLKTEELFKILKPCKNIDLFGSYNGFISQCLKEHKWENDINHALKWVTSQKGAMNIGHILSKLEDTILLQAWERLDSPGVLEEFAKAILSRIKFDNFKIIVDRDYSKKFWELLKYDDEKRRKLVDAIAPLLLNSDLNIPKFRFSKPKLIFPKDIRWMIECLKKTCSQKEKEIWAEFIDFEFDVDSAENVSAIMSAYKDEPFLNKIFAQRFKPILLDSPEAEKRKTEFYQMQKMIQNEEKEKSNIPSPSERILRLLDDFESGDLSAWWEINRMMAVEGNSELYGDESESNLTKLPGWQNADDVTRDRILDAATRYIIEQPSDTTKWLGTNIFYFTEIAAYKALMLLIHELPDSLSSFNEGIWKKWAPIILAYPISYGTGDEKIHYAIVKLTYQLVPDEIIKTLLLLIDKENQKEGCISITRKLELCWDEKLIKVLELKLKDENLKPEAVGSLLEDLLKRHSVQARSYAEVILSQPIPLEGDARKRAAITARMLILFSDDAGWEVVWPIFQKDVDFGKEVISSVAESIEPMNIRVENRLTDEQLADLYIWLEKQFPHKEDIHLTSGAASPRQLVAWWRESILTSLTNRGTHRASEGIRKIMKAFPEMDGLHRRLYDAQKIALKQTWKPLPIKAILEVAKNKDKRLVRNEQELLEVLVESLKRLESKLHGVIPAARDIWDCSGKKNKKWRPVNENAFSDYVKRHFDDDLIRKGIIVNREVQIHKGERTDLHVDAISIDRDEDSFKKLTVIIEVKGSWHNALDTAMKEQLAKDYLTDNICKTGIYLVGWFNCESWDKEDYQCKNAPKINREEAQEKYDKQAAELSKKGFNIRAVVLDTSF